MVVVVVVVMEGTDFGQSRFGHPDLTNLGRSNLGQSNLGRSIWIWVCVCHGVGPRRVGHPRVGGPRISRFFFPLPPFVSLWVSSRGILVVFEAPEPSNVHVGNSWIVV